VSPEDRRLKAYSTVRQGEVRVPGLESLPLVATTNVELPVGLVEGRGDIPWSWNGVRSEERSGAKNQLRQIISIL